MQSLPRIDAFAEDLTALRHDFHAHPELGFQEHRTSARIAGLLESWGIEVTRGIGGTGLVGVLQGRGPGRRIGLRADMDALPMEELTNLPYASKTPGVFHGCGHDGHITMLLGAARYLAETRDFDGTAIFIFQPAEEGLGGARAMIEDGLFERFPCDELYGLHNSPYHPLGQVTLRPGLAQAGACFFDIRVQGQGAHGAYPHLGKDPVTIGAGLVKELQEITARNADPLHPVVVSVTAFRAGEAYNVIPDSADLRGTFRFLRPEDRDLIDRRMRQICAGMALAHGVAIEVDIRGVFSPLRNDPQSVEHLIAAAREVVGEKAAADAEVIMGSEDMADFLALVPGAFFNLGHGSGVPVHNPHFILDDRILPVGASIFARLVERRGTR